MPQRDIHTFVSPLCRRLAADMGYDLIDVELVKEGPGRYLRIYLDKEGGFSLDDCERFHRAVQPKLEPVDYDFLEVSSPGIDRPLKTDRDFERAVGTEVEVRLFRPVDGSKAFVGTLTGYDETALRLTVGAQDRAIPRKDAALIKPVIAFDEEDGGESKE